MDTNDFTSFSNDITNRIGNVADTLYNSLLRVEAEIGSLKHTLKTTNTILMLFLVLSTIYVAFNIYWKIRSSSNKNKIND
ncbi:MULTISPECIES: hypothetical protein [unclassified Paenibacillus]|uniref:hypothetical protein n=1 Tax=unclassified Paenibacillus TaxID=185978 RepID=UPI001C111AB4|nr:MULTISPECIES: hypothetical protein [unclassified Paenibacillus]MBU5445120.1 hypothetical protein [Paenibacillus sp. MSJ-34]